MSDETDKICSFHSFSIDATRLLATLTAFPALGRSAFGYPVEDEAGAPDLAQLLRGARVLLPEIEVVTMRGWLRAP